MLQILIVKTREDIKINGTKRIATIQEQAKRFDGCMVVKIASHLADFNEFTFIGQEIVLTRIQNSPTSKLGQTR